MILKVADLLEALKQKEQEILKKYGNIGHAPTIGSMYEGLTQTLVNKSIFSGMDIRVVSGKIINSKGAYSDQIDCMLVEGKGEQIPYTKDYIYHINKVIAVIEVKKNLYSKDLRSAYQNLRSVIEIHEPKSIKSSILRDSYRTITNHELPDYDQLKMLPIGEQMMYHLLVEESILPIRIVFGYNGFASEYSLRESYVKYLNENLSTNSENTIKGFGVVSFPNLIVCNNYSLIKLNAMPYALKVQYGDGREESSDFYHIYGSYSKNPLLILLELIWTRLSYQFGLPSDVFGEDLQVEVTHPFLECRINQLDGKYGWEYKYHDLKQNFLDNLGYEEKWEPTFLNEKQHLLISLLCNEDKINVNDPFIDDLIGDGSKVDFIKCLKKTYLVAIDQVDNLYLLTDECQTMILPDGRLIAADNKTGKLTRWVMNYMNEQKRAVI